MTRPKAPTNLTIVLSLALIATPLTIDQRGGFGVNQASARTGHSVSEPGGEGSTKDKVADARQAGLDAAIRGVLENKLQKLEAREATRNRLIEALEVEVQDTLNTMNVPEP
jgi:hypothetical protein